MTAIGYRLSAVGYRLSAVRYPLSAIRCRLSAVRWLYSRKRGGACGAEGHMASIGPPALGAKGCVERLHPTGETTHYDLCVAGAPANHVRCASLTLRGPPIGGQDRDGASYRCSAPYTLCLFEAFPSRGNEKYGEEKQRVIYFMYHFSVSPFGGERSEPITRVYHAI